MSRVDELIAELCPDGVGYWALGEIGEIIRGRRFTKADYVDVGLESIHYGEIYTTYGLSATETVSHVRPELKDRLRLAEPGDLVIAGTGENSEDLCKAVAWLGKGPVAVHDDCYILRHGLNPKFASYCFQTSAFHKQKAAYVSEAKVSRVAGRDLAQIRVPVPPYEVQVEVVRILDQFRELEAELEDELQAELEARRRQYEHYRQVILSSIEAGHVAVRELGLWRGGVTPSKAEPRFWEAGDIPWLASMDVSEQAGSIRGRVTAAALAETSLRLIPAPSVVVVMRSNILRRRLPVGLVTVPTTVNQDIRALIPRTDVDAEYVYQALRAASEELRVACVRTDGSMAAVDSNGFFDFRIPLPPLEEQRQVAERLSSFDAFMNDLDAGVSAELAARRKQYEHYRDKLLTFKELAA